MSEPKLIPIYDETAPIACTLSKAEIPERVALLERLRTAMTAIDRTATGILLHFPDAPTVRADLAAFTFDEMRCCRFWGFAITDEPGGVALRWDGPAAVDPLLDQLQTLFSTNGPISTLEGLPMKPVRVAVPAAVTSAGT